MHTATGTQIFVGNIPWSSDEDDLRHLFEDRNVEVDSARIICDKETSKSMGFGFVTIADGQNPDDVVRKLADSNLGGRVLKIERAKGVVKRAARGSS